jgi:uncharacterized protein YdeI (YjbR/CyaY-like superfamily)
MIRSATDWSSSNRGDRKSFVHQRRTNLPARADTDRGCGRDVNQDQKGDPIFFAEPAEFRRWLDDHHADGSELWVGFYKVATGRPSLTWNQSVDEALCFGWIDGIRKRIDDDSYMIRFTPRTARSRWSGKNLKAAERLIATARMTPAGLLAFRARRAERSGASSFGPEQGIRFPSELEGAFSATCPAWSCFKAQPPGYQKSAWQWVTSAKREETRRKRFDRLMEVSARGERLNLVSPFEDHS